MSYADSVCMRVTIRYTVLLLGRKVLPHLSAAQTITPSASSSSQAVTNKGLHKVHVKVYFFKNTQI